MAQEIERSGIPTALFTALDTIAQSVGCYRIVRGTGVLHVTGDPHLAETEERAWRRRLLDRALQAIETRVERPEVFLTQT
jgi:glycine reductase